MNRILLIFVDGLGLAPEVSHNPLASIGLRELEGEIGARLVEPGFGDGGNKTGSGKAKRSLDAVLGVEGIPQSGTGQTAIYSGRNAQALVGRHVPALPGRTLRDLLERDSIFRFRDPSSERRSVAFANAYTSAYLDRIKRGTVRMSAAVSAAWAADVRLRDEQDLERGRAVSWDVTNEHFGVPLPALRRTPRGRRWTGLARPHTTVLDPVSAAIRLVQLASDFRLTIYETYLADLAGHRRFVIDEAIALERLDSFLTTAIRRRTPDMTVVVTSDHGNIEDLSTPQHTRNPVPLLAVGPASTSFNGTSRIDEVRWVIEAELEKDDR